MHLQKISIGNFKNISSLEIDKIKPKFDMIICGFFLYQLDRDDIFLQFDKTSTKVSETGLDLNKSIQNKFLLNKYLIYF